MGNLAVRPALLGLRDGFVLSGVIQARLIGLHRPFAQASSSRDVGLRDPGPRGRRGMRAV